MTTKHTALKPFTSNTQRFRAGQEVAADADLSPHTFADLKSRGFIGEVKAEPEKPAAGERRNK